VDIATYYSGTTLMWGMFTSSGAPQKPYYAFLAFRRLLDTPRRVAVQSTANPDLKTLAGLSEDGKLLRVLISYTGHGAKDYQFEFKNLPWRAARCREQIVDDQRDLAGDRTVRLEGANAVLHEQIKGPSVTLLSISANP
jgi:hypothetical protein